MRLCMKWVSFLAVMGVVCSISSAFGADPAVSGELKQWHKVTLTFDGPDTREIAEPNPFTFYRLDVTFTHADTGQSYVVPGYYATDGNAAETSADSGNQWRVHFAPTKTGKWNYVASFRKGKMIYADDNPKAGESAGYMDGHLGSFDIAVTDKAGRDFRGKGLLEYVGKHHLKFAGTGEYFLKCGPDAPETLLGYADFDGTVARKGNVPLKKFDSHMKDWKPGDPTWQNGKGKGIIGALNYLAAKGVNAFSFLTYNAGGDGDNVWPFRERDDKFRYDCSKLDQWQIVFDHAQQLGLYLHFKTQETEIDDNILGGHQQAKKAIVKESLDGGDLGPERKLYYRELIARFGYELALNWNLGEENTQTPEQQKAMASCFAKHDPYQHNIVIHTFPNQQDKVYTALLGEQSELTGVSLQNDWKQTHRRTLQWVTESAKAGKPWVVANDEQGSASEGVPPDTGYQGFDPKSIGYDLHDIRKRTLWGNLMAGGAGVEYYFGYKLPENDLVCEDYRSRDKSWDYGRIAIEFFHDEKIPFWDMQNQNDLIGNTDNNQDKYCLARKDQLYVIYLGYVPTTQIDLGRGQNSYTIEWFNPRQGGDLKTGTLSAVQGPGKKWIGYPPAEKDQDWVAVLKPAPSGTEIPPQPEITLETKAPEVVTSVDGLFVLEAINNFNPVEKDGFVGFYKDNGRKALAINAAQHKDKFASASTVFQGKDDTYDLTLISLTETDGESTYKVLVDGKMIGQFQNPEAASDYQEIKKTWAGVPVKKGSVLEVQFNSASNGKIPEGNGFAYSRGRWRRLMLTSATNPPDLSVLTEAEAPQKQEPPAKTVSSPPLCGTAGPAVIFEEKDGLVAVEAEHFTEQTMTEKRAWYIHTTEMTSQVEGPDGDGSHADTASGGAYIEILPDTRRTHGDKLIHGENFSGEPGQLAVVSYPVFFNTPGRYYVWVRAYSTGSEDNGIHVGLDGQWPESGRRLQWCEGKNSWRWESKQRTTQQHCGVPHEIYLDVDQPGLHFVSFSLREDGFEMDKWLMTTDRDFARPEDAGPAERIVKPSHTPGAGVYVEKDGMIIMECENTETEDLGLWEVVKPGDPRYVQGASNGVHLEFTGNGINGGKASSPLVYRFKPAQSGNYHLHIRAHKRLDGAGGDKCNDGYVIMEGDFTSGNPKAKLAALKRNTKLYGGAADGWDWASNLDSNDWATEYRSEDDADHTPAIYNFKAGETYTLTVSGRSIRFNMDRIVLHHESVPANEVKKPNHPESPRKS